MDKIIKNHYPQRKNQNSRETQQHYCTVCKQTMPNNQTTILLHEQSQRHIDNQQRLVTTGKVGSALG